MHKLLTKIATLSVGLAMAVGVGVAVGSKAAKVSAAQGDRVDALSEIVSGKNYYIRATVGETDYYWKAGGGVAVGTSLSGTSTTSISDATQVTLTGSGSSWAIKLASGNYLSLPSSKANGKYDVVSESVNWTITEVDGLLNLSINGYCLMKNSSASLNFGSYQSGQKNVWLEEGEAARELKSISLSKDDTKVKTSYFNGETSSLEGLTVTATYDSGDPADVTSSAVITANPATVDLLTTSISYTATFGGKTSNSVTVTGVSVTNPNPIQVLYSKAKGASIDAFYGYYVGFQVGSGPILMDGEYGILLYNSSQSVEGWVEGETIVHVKTGTIDVYGGLYEVKSYTLETVESAELSTPVVHATTGSETAVEANRLTNASGHVAAAPTKGNFTDPAGTSDIQFTYTVGSNTFAVYYKKAAQTDEVIAVLADSLANSTEITLKGFTSWYNNFQLQMNGIVEAKDEYTAEDFAQDLLDQTDAVCTGWKEGDNNHDALVAIWSDLASVDKYPSLPATEKTILAEAERDESGTVVEQAMARYDFLTGKYSLSNFINGRTPIVPAGAPYVTPESNTLGSTSVVTIVVIVSLLSVSTIGVCFIIRRHKMY